MKKVYFNKQLLIAGSALVVIVTVSSVVCASLILCGFIGAKSTFDKYGCAIMFFGMGLAMLVVGVICYPKWSCYYVIGPSDVQIKVGKTKETVNINFYRYVYRGYYTHGSVIGIKRKIYFLVISHKKMSESQLSHINTLDNPYLLRIRHTKKAQGILENQLPSRLREQLHTFTRSIE